MGSVLFGQGVVVRRKNPAVEQALDLLDPGMAEIVEDAGVDTRPVVNRHECCARESRSVAAMTPLYGRRLLPVTSQRETVPGSRRPIAGDVRF